MGERVPQDTIIIDVLMYWSTVLHTLYMHFQRISTIRVCSNSQVTVVYPGLGLDEGEHGKDELYDPLQIMVSHTSLRATTISTFWDMTLIRKNESSSTEPLMIFPIKARDHPFTDAVQFMVCNFLNWVSTAPWDWADICGLGGLGLHLDGSSKSRRYW